MLRCLQSVFDDPAEGGMEVLVVDNASTDGSVQAAVEAFPEVKVIRSRRNLGYAGGCNLGMTFAHGPFFLLLNDDAELTPGCIETLLQRMEQDDTIAAVQPKILSRDHPEYFDYAGAAGGMIDIFGYPFARGRIFFTTEPDRGQYDEDSEIFWASGTCCLLRRKALDRVGFLDEAFFAHMEEIDLNWRMHLAGFKIVYVAGARVYHQGAATLASDSPKKHFLNHRNNLLMLCKNYSPASLMWILPIRLFLETIGLIYVISQGQLAHALAIMRAWMAAVAAMPYLRRKRKSIKRLRRIADRELRKRMYRGSIVYQYFLRGRKDYRSLSGVTNG